jgi:Sulfotransferase domain
MPEFFVIGAMKCGTTSLHGYLDEHPEIGMSRVKEPDFFVQDQPERADWYESLFPDAPVRGESSIRYSSFPLIDGVPERIRAAAPDAKLVYVVGDPLRRIVAHWVESYYGEADREPQAIHARRAGRPLMEGLADYDDPYNFYVSRSRYATQVERYLEAFSPERLLVIDQDDLGARPLETMRELFRFLEVDDSFESPAFGERVNVGDGRRRRSGGYSAMRRRLMALGLDRVPERYRRPVGRRLGRVFSKPVERPRLDASTLPGLTALLKDEADRLRAITGKRFAGWSV